MLTPESRHDKISTIDMSLINTCVFRSRLVTQEIPFKKGCVYAVILSVGTPIGIVLGVAVEAKLTGTTLLITTAVIQVCV